jgi:hypothetical protein
MGHANLLGTIADLMITRFPERVSRRIRLKSGTDFSMIGRLQPMQEEKNILLLEWLAASVTLCMIAIVLYMVFAYKPV